MKIVKEAKTLTYCLTDNVSNIDEIIEFLKKELKYSQVVRVCIHKNNDDLTHSMIIAISKEYEMKLHKNFTKNKIYFILEGKIEFEIEEKKIIAQRGDIVNIGKNNFMRQKSLSDFAIYMENIAGPFKKGDTVYAS